MTTADAVRGWQNVARIIRQHIAALTTKPSDAPLTAVEVAEAEAWETAHQAVVDGLHEADHGSHARTD